MDRDENVKHTANRFFGGSRITVKDVARESGVSVSTVSRALSNNPAIAESTRERIKAKAKEMAYQPNFYARGLIRKRSSVVALFANNITNPFYPEVVVKLTRRLREINLHTMIFSSADALDVIPALQEINTDVAVLLAATMTPDSLQQFNESKTPIILFNRYVTGARASAVCCDNLAAGRLVVKKLAQAGHQRLAFIGGLEKASTNADRLKGFREGIAIAGLPEPIVCSNGDFTYETGYAGVQEAFSKDSSISAVFCANDIIAVGASDAARRELDLVIPDDLAIVGFDDIALAAWPSHDLTTVRQPMEQMIDCVIAEILRFQNDRFATPKQYFLPGKLVVRGSAKLDYGSKNENY
jgi:DNA-binding LacI/PurR family transcriptional regulator